MTEIRFAFDVGERVIDTDRDFTTGTVVRQLELANYRRGYNTYYNMYEVQWDGREAGFLHQAREGELRTACLPVIGAVVAMVAADQLCWIVWARGVPSEMEGYEDLDWEEEAELGSRPEAMRTMAARAAKNEELRGKYKWQVRLEWKVLPEGVQP